MKLSGTKNMLSLMDMVNLQPTDDTNLHPNVLLLTKLDINDKTQMRSKFSKNIVWRFFNPKIRNIDGDYHGVGGVVKLFELLDIITRGAFEYTPIKTIAVGNELVMMHVKNRISSGTNPIELNTVLVWRIVNEKIAEVWNIPTVYNY